MKTQNLVSSQFWKSTKSLWACDTGQRSPFLVYETWPKYSRDSGEKANYFNGIRDVNALRKAGLKFWHGIWELYSVCQEIEKLKTTLNTRKLDRLLVQWTISTQSDQPCFTFFDLRHQNAMDSPKKVSWRYVFPSSIACLSRIPSDVWIDDVTNGTKCMTPQSAQMRA